VFIRKRHVGLQGWCKPICALSCLIVEPNSSANRRATFVSRHRDERETKGQRHAAASPLSSNLRSRSSLSWRPS
jgi:hypothetical protein